MSKVSERPSTGAAMPSAAIIVRDVVIAAAGERGWSDTREAWIARAARRLGLNYRRARAIFYGEARRIDADEYLSLILRAESLRLEQARQEAVNAAIQADLRARAAVAVGRGALGEPLAVAPGGRSRRAAPA